MAFIVCCVQMTWSVRSSFCSSLHCDQVAIRLQESVQQDGKLDCMLLQLLRAILSRY